VKKNQCENGLVLSGGGTRGFAHLGALQALNEYDIFPDIISGVSAGAIAGAFYADGKTPTEIFNILTSKKLRNYIKSFFPKRGLVNMSGFMNTLKDNLSVKNIEDLKIPIIINAVNLNKGTYVSFENGDLISAIQASAAIPVVFPPVKISDDYYVDGGVINNFPVQPLVGKCKRIIGINLNSIGENYDLNSIKKIAERSFQVSLLNHTNEAKKICDIYIEPPNLDNYGFISLSKAQEVFDSGYNETIKILKESKLN
jgi:NTE family protein